MAKITIESDEPVIVLPMDEYNTIMERLEILSDTELMEDIREALAEFDDGKTVEFREFWREEMIGV